MAQNFNISKEELTSPQFQHSTLGEENNEVSILIDPRAASQMQGVASQNSYNSYEPHGEWAPERAIMFYAVPEELTSPQFQHNTLGEENNEVLIVIDPQDASQMRGVASQNSYNNYEPHDEWAPERAIMFYAVPIILGVAQLLLSLHIFEVI